MFRNYIDQHRLVGAVDSRLDAASPALHPHRPQLRRLLLRWLPTMALGTRTIADGRDPQWARDRSSRGERLYRLGAEGELAARRLASDLLFDVERLAMIGADDAHPFRARAARALRGMPHWTALTDWDDWEGPPEDLSQRLGLSQILLAADESDRRRGEDARHASPARLTAGRLTGRRTTTLGEVLALGREARNCLSKHGAARESIAAGHDVWALREGPTLVALIEVGADGVVRQMRGPRNGTRFTGYLLDIVQFCTAAGFKVGMGIEVKLADLMPAPLQVTGDAGLDLARLIRGVPR